MDSVSLLTSFLDKIEAGADHLEPIRAMVLQDALAGMGMMLVEEIRLHSNIVDPSSQPSELSKPYA